jgi:hypothetical protein
MSPEASLVCQPIDVKRPCEVMLVFDTEPNFRSKTIAVLFTDPQN